jgi:hypothetical protein
MRRAGKTGSCTFAVLIGCLAGTPVGAQQVQHPGAARVPDLFAQAQPHLEAALGGKIQRLPEFRILTAAEFQRLSDPELEASLHWLFPELKDEAFARAAVVVRYVASLATVARHIEGGDVIHVLPDNLPTIAAWDTGLAAVNEPAFLQLALVHEVARLALERRYDLARRRHACRDAEEFFALQALVEGQAAWLTREVARKLDTEGHFPLLAQRYLRIPDNAPDPALRTMSQLSLRKRHWASTQGLAFFEHLHAKGLADAEQRAFTRPPRLTGWVERPELYVRAEQAKRTDLATALRALEGTLPAGDWSVVQQPWTAEMVRQVAALVGEKARAERAVAGWDEGRSLVWALRKDAGKQVAVSLARHQTEAGARTYYGFAVDLQRKQDEMAGGSCAPTVRMLESKATAVRLPGFDEAVRNDKRMQYGAGGPPVAVSTLLARSGDLVIEFSWYGLPVEMDWASRVIGAALAASRGQ